MNARGGIFGRGMFSGACVVALVASGAALSGVRWNVSPSLPRGLYRWQETRIERGAIVLACVPEAVAGLFRERGYLGVGDCPGGVAPLGKPIAAIAGDVVEVREEGVAIDGVLVPRSRPWLRDSEGRLLPSLIGRRFVIARDQVFLLSTHHPRSLDSRVFGPIESEGVRAGLIPLLVERKKGSCHEP